MDHRVWTGGGPGIEICQRRGGDLGFVVGAAVGQCLGLRLDGDVHPSLQPSCGGGMQDVPVHELQRGRRAKEPHTVSRPTGFTYTLVGLGVNAGTIFEFVVTNTTDQPIVVEIPAGTVFKPDQPTVQREVTDQPQTVAAAPQQTAQTPLTGYCLDYGLQAPPAGIRGALPSNGALVAAVNADAVLAALPQTPSVKYTVDDNPAAYAPILKIIQAGNQLSSQGKFHRDLPPDRYKLAVIQRAIWTYTSKGGKTPHTRETMLADIKKQVRETGGEQTDAQINDLVNHLQEDINAVLSAAGVQ